jgi:hypothetical protein
MRHRLGEFVLERLVLPFQFRKMLLNSHVGGLLRYFGLNCQLCHEVPRKSTFATFVQRNKTMENGRGGHSLKHNGVNAILGWPVDTPAAATCHSCFQAALMTKEEERELRANLARLMQEHRDLDAAIEALEHAPGRDRLQIQRLKKRKLQLRDRITFIEDQLTPDIIA